MHHPLRSPAFSPPSNRRRLVNSLSRRTAALLSVVVLGAALPASAQTVDTWTGGAGGFTNWQNPGNWASGTVPAAGDTLHFASGSFTTLNNDFGDATSFVGLVQDAGAPGFVLNGSRVFLSGGSIANNSANPFTIQFNNSFGETMRFTGSVSVNAAAGNILIAPTSNGGVVTLNFGTITTFDSGAGRSVSVSSNLNDNGTSLVNSGLLILSGNNASYGGQTEVRNGATLQLQANAANTNGFTAASTALGANNLVLDSGSAVQLRADSAATFTGGNNLSGVGNATVGFDVGRLGTTATGQTLTFAPGGFATYNTTINVSGSNGYSLALGGVTNGYGGSLTLNANTANLTVGAIGSAGSISDLAVGGSANTTITGAINASGAVTKNGGGTLTLAGANTYAGATSVNAGTLLVNGSVGGSAVTVQQGTGNAVLGGAGTINAPVTVAGSGFAGQSGTLLGGSGAVGTTLTLTNNLTLTDYSQLAFTLGTGGAHSALARTGGAWTFGNNLEFLFSGSGFAPGTYSGLITGLASDPGNEGSWTFVNSGLTGSFVYRNGNIDLNLTSVPEPATLLGGLLLIGVAAWRGRAFRSLGRASL